jgi:phage-related protein
MMKKPGRPKKNLNIKIDTKNIDVNITRKDGVTDVKVDTPKVDVELHKDNEGKSLKIDSEKIDVTIDKGEVKVDINEQSGIIGKIAKILLKKFKK